MDILYSNSHPVEHHSHIGLIITYTIFIKHQLQLDTLIKYKIECVPWLIDQIIL